MKKRLLVMNGSKVTQHANKDGEWENQKVEKAGSLKPGIYNIYNATEAIPSEKYTGMIVHTDKESVYQQVGKSFVAHSVTSFASPPEVGSMKTISYSSEGKAGLENAPKLTRSNSL